MTKKGKELIFISWIKRDGSGTVAIGTPWNDSCDFPKTDDMSYQDEDDFDLNALSLTEKTFIASGFNSFVVKFIGIVHCRLGYRIMLNGSTSIPASLNASSIDKPASISFSASFLEIYFVKELAEERIFPELVRQRTEGV